MNYLAENVQEIIIALVLGIVGGIMGHFLEVLLHNQY
jgi:H+/Cl- antiporter ClcA